MKKYQITIARRANQADHPVMQTYRFEADDGEILSVMDGLEYIYQNIDTTIAFFHHAACHQAACGKCLLKLNGKTVLSCKEQLNEGAVLLEPANENVVCDLICK